MEAKKELEAATGARRREVTLPDWLSVKDAAAQKGVSTRAVYQRINSGDLCCARVGDLLLVYRKDVEAWTVAAAKQQNGKARKKIA